MLQDRANLGSKALEEAAAALVAAARSEPAIGQAFSPFRAAAPRIFADVDRVKAKMLNVPLDNIFSTMQVYLGSLFVNELNLFGRTFRVTAQADIPFRDDARDLVDATRQKIQSGIVLLASVQDGKVSFIVAVSKDVAGSRYNAGTIARNFAKLIDGSGGGKPDFAQGGGKDASKVDAALTAIEGNLA